MKPAPNQRSSAPVTLADLINAHVEAQRLHLEAMRVVDATKDDDAARAAAEEKQYFANEAEDAAIEAICSYRPVDDDERAKRSDFLKSTFRQQGGQEPTDEQMAAMIDAASPGVRLPYANQAPGDDLSGARSLLRLLGETLERGHEHGLAAQRCTDLSVVLFEAQEILSAVQQFLNDLDYRTIIEDYQAARIASMNADGEVL